MGRWEGGDEKSEIGVVNKIGKNTDLNSDFRIPTSDFKRVPIIAMTAHAMAGDEQKSIDAGMNDHVTKPIDPDQLFATLQKWIKPAAGRSAVPKSSPASGGLQIPDATPAPDQAMPLADELPESLPEFDLQTGLARLMGNKRLYRKLLLDFGANYGGVAKKISDALAVGDLEQAHSLVHDLKGLAGTLGAKDLQAAALKMEKLVKGKTVRAISDRELDREFIELENSLEQALNAVENLGDFPMDEKKTISSSNKAIASVPPELIEKVTSSIGAAAEMGDVMHIKSIAEEFKSESNAIKPLCDELIQLADDFDFDGIKKMLIELDI